MPENAGKDDWEELIRSDFYLYNVCVPMHSIQYSNEFLGGPKYEKLLFYLKDNIAYYYENFRDHFRVGEYCLGIFLKDKKRFEQYLEFWNKEFEKIEALFARIRAADLSKLEEKKLAELLEELYKKAIYWHGIAYNVDAIDATLLPLMQKIIEECYPAERKSIQAEIYNKLTFPEKLSYVNRMALEKLELFSQAAEKPALAKKNVPNFVEKYYWVNFKWGESEEYSEKDFWAEAQKADLANAARQLSETKKRFESEWMEKKRLAEEIAKKRPVIRDYVKIFDEYAAFHDFRKEGQVKSAYYLRKIYGEISKRIKVQPKQLYYYWPMELAEIIKQNKKADTALLEKRGKEWFCEYYQDGKWNETFGPEALKKRDKAIGASYLQDHKELEGIAASRGRIIGKAKICLSAEIAKQKIQPGDILVTGMTMPEFAPSMGKAAAIVTDEGGLTCHAAIIARELGKPCVVGTKMATRVIRDGDLLEVNANHGVVKILQRQ